MSPTQDSVQSKVPEKPFYDESQVPLKRKRLSILINIISPYRVPIYRSLSESFETVVIEGHHEDNRQWGADLDLQSLNVKRTWSLQLVRQRKTAIPGVNDRNYVQLNFGLLTDLPATRPDIIVTNEMGVRTLIALLYGKIARVPVWIWSGGTLHTDKNIGAGKRVVRKFISRIARHWISYGEEASEYLISLSVPRTRILQIQNCVDESNFKPDPLTRAAGLELLAGLPRPVALCVGQLIARKGVSHLLASAARLQREGQDFSLVFAGNGPDANQLKDLVSQLGLRHVRFLGETPKKQIRGLYQASDFLVFPTLEDPWGLVVNEALWSGIPVISSKCAGSSRELVSPSSQFDPLDPTSFDGALRAAIQGHLERPDRSCLIPIAEVSQMIIDSINQGSPVRLPSI